jgi:hypothetical protein
MGWLRIVLPKILFESFLIVVSILLALAVNDWQTGRERHRYALQALRGFQREIQQNRARLQDIAPFRMGIREVLAKPEATSSIHSAADFQMAIGTDGFRPAFLTETAWETALATGALQNIDFETVSALSLTYSLQKRAEEFSRESLPPLVRGAAVPAAEMPPAIHNAATYLDELIREEAELLAAYDQALKVLNGTGPGSPAAQRPAL